MNLLFVNYGDFTSNSLNHIGGFAHALSAGGHACAVAVPEGLETLRHVADPLFIPVSHAEAVARPGLFPDGRPADVIHAWTPRENVRKCCLGYQRAVVAGGGTPARLVIHLEDNEHFLLESYTGRSLAQLREMNPGELAGLLNERLAHPFRAESFLGLADGVTHIIGPLAESVPPGVPSLLLFPGVDFQLYRPDLAGSAEVAAERAALGLAPGERLVVFTGSNTFANEPEMRELYLAVALLNQQGVPCRLLRTGLNSPRFQAGLPEDVRRHVTDLGFVEKRRLPGLLALADVLVQPGHPGPYNDYRLPSKLPEFLASGRPVVLPRANVASLLREGREALFLGTGTPEDIAAACRRVLDEPRLAAELGRGGAAFARQHFDLAANTLRLAEFYAATSGRAPRANWAGLREETASDATLFAGALAARWRAEGDAPARGEVIARAELLAGLVRDLEREVEHTARQREAVIATDRDAVLAREALTRDHTRNLENLLAAAREHATGLEHARELTQTHAEHVSRERDQHRLRREQADELLRAARQQMVALEDALLRSEAERESLAASADSTRTHATNLESLLAAAREHAAGLEQERELTRDHVANLTREMAASRRHATELAAERDRLWTLREQAEALLRTTRRQLVAFENELLTADAELAELRPALIRTREELDETRERAERGAAAALQAEAELRARHAAELAAERAAAAQRLVQAQDLLRTREDKIRRMQESLSWRATAPFRALRRAFMDDSSVPAVSPELLGNVDYPQDWSRIAPTLNVRGWSLHRDRVPLRALRARLGRTPGAVEFGLERLDVLDHFRDHPGAERSGWIVKVEVPRFGRHLLLIEAQDANGVWHPVVSRLVRRTAAAAPPPPNTYAAWVAAYDSLTPKDSQQIRGRLARLSRKPLISVLLPVYDAPEKWLVRAIESVRAQLYPHWELCIADDASRQPHVRRVLERYQRRDPQRIKVVFRETNGHISAASNSALALAHGEFLALLDHDDELRPHALACVALELAAHPDADLVYSDEDKVDENGHRYDPYFKPDWNPDLFNVQNFISHLGVYRTLLVREVGGFRVGYEGSQDWDLAMRVIERSAPERIRHIPKILYHWRSVPGSTALLIGAKNYAAQAAEKVIREHFTRLGVEARLSPTKGSYWRVHYPLPAPAPRVTLIIPTRNRLEVLRPCMESLLGRTSYPDFEVLIVDNGSDDPATLAYLEEVARPVAGRAPVRVLPQPGEFNYSALNNAGVAATDAPVLALLNNDLEVIHDDWLDEMVSHAIRPEIGCVGAKLYYPDDRIQHAGVILGVGGVAAHAWQTHPRGAAGQAHRNLLQQNLSAVTAACLVVRREVYLQAGGFNADQLKVAFNDVDFCLKVRAAGYRNLWTPYAELYHHESASRGKEDTLEKRDRFRAEVEHMRSTWGELLDRDPAYNPNLTLTINDFTLALPPRPWPPLA